MPDSRFRKTVLVVTTHGKSGHIGVIVNRSEDIKLDQTFPDSVAAKELSLFMAGLPIGKHALPLTTIS